MHTAGAADGDGQVGALEILIARNPFLEKSRNVVDHALHHRRRVEKGADGLVLAGEGTKLRFPIRVGQAAHVEHEVCIGWQAVLVAERLDHDGHRARRARRDALANLLAQRINTDIRVVSITSSAELMIGANSSRSLAIASSRLVLSVGQRMFTARLAEAR